MRIAFIVQPWDVVWPQDDGGKSAISTYVYQLARRLTNMKNNVVIYSRKVDQLPLEEMDEQGIFHRRIDLAFEDKLMRPLNILDRLRALGQLKHPLWAYSFWYATYWRQIGKDIAGWNPDIVHIQNFSQFVPMVRRIVPKARIVLHMHCEWLSQLDPSMIKRRLQQTDLILGCSEDITRKVRNRFPDLSVGCHTLYRGIDLSQFSPPEALELRKKNGRNLLFVSRLSPEKGVHVLLDAFGLVLKRFPDACLQIVGGIGSIPPQLAIAISDDNRVQELSRFYKIPPSRPDFYYQQLLTRLPANEMNRVTFIGSITYNSMPGEYRKADILINSSLWESFGLPILEAMASGLPVIASEVGGIPEIVKHEETGLLFKPGDPHSLAKAIIRLLEDEELSRNLRIRASQEIKRKFSWDVLNEELWRHYQSLLSSN